MLTSILISEDIVILFITSSKLQAVLKVFLWDNTVTKCSEATPGIEFHTILNALFSQDTLKL